MDQHIVYLSIGSNIGDKKQNLENAITLLHKLNKIDVVCASSFYKTQPQNYIDQDWFVNAALKIKTLLEPQELLAVLKTVEKDLDKEGKSFRFGPRVIDLDIIYYEDLILKTKTLEIPHPRMHQRCFVLIPMCDIGAHTIHPVLKCRSDDLLKKIEKQETQKVILLDKEA
ncbi:MAG: 2-amino-4-hydroxy-6-hydroxymethyldihydropteridine diphosphokinase [Desulfobacula sp.]|uniref:2-amino-4-hydroxy-6- hydroxymethyldihydropteridine diphosphokinase n=1 Tax=Desulfobacula sp. TaxID=2593537 RepID=UPI0025BC5A7D|nr:2-amino-4-hydroxy-6-hydroxymethyldihydropteridine diphosphokinase [Desulfobacula sp.]MCD4722080.1 2-amino-4-hydroxy-6-hydroxymethyldihydropteridine diphosphokinase [Desulfobacula sp.]